MVDARKEAGHCAFRAGRPYPGATLLRRTLWGADAATVEAMWSVLLDVSLRQAVQVHVSPGRNGLGVTSTRSSPGKSPSLQEHRQADQKHHAHDDDHSQRSATPGEVRGVRHYPHLQIV